MLVYNVDEQAVEVDLTTFVRHNSDKQSDAKETGYHNLTCSEVSLRVLRLSTEREGAAGHEQLAIERDTPRSARSGTCDLHH